MKTQTLALSRLMGKIWGPGLIQARLIYAQVIRAVLAFGASAYHIPTSPRATSEAQGITRKLIKIENNCLRMVL